MDSTDYRSNHVTLPSPQAPAMAMVAVNASATKTIPAPPSISTEQEQQNHIIYDNIYSDHVNNYVNRKGKYIDMNRGSSKNTMEAISSSTMLTVTNHRNIPSPTALAILATRTT